MDLFWEQIFFYIIHDGEVRDKGVPHYPMMVGDTPDITGMGPLQIMYVGIFRRNTVNF